MKIDGLDITWLGHATWLIGTPEGKTLLVDPWTRGNPFCPPAFHEVKPDVCLVTHGHNDHIGDLVEVCRRTGAPTVCIYEIAMYLGRNGIDNALGMNKGGRVQVDAANVWVAMTNAHHSSAFFESDGVVHYLGEAAGFVVGFSNGTRLYIAGDTCLFGDMRLIRDLWSPQIAILPIGDWYTMDPKQAAMACQFTGVSKVLGSHWGSFPALTGNPSALRDELAKLGAQTEVVDVSIGQ